MNDDLKQRLRKVEGGNHYGATVWYKNPDGPEAADQIEKLETNFQLQLEWYLSNKRVLDDRIKKLEAALKKIALDDPDCCMIADRMRETAEIALGLKND
jgi:hypothetical protein